jgi:hypothetical protein
MDISDPDYDPIQPESLGITKERWNAIIKMLANDGYIDGVVIKSVLRSGSIIMRFEPQITLKGLEYLSENSMMKKAMNVVKGIKEIFPEA